VVLILFPKLCGEKSNRAEDGPALLVNIDPFREKGLLFRGRFDETAGDARSGVAAGLGGEVILFGVDDEGLADDVVLFAAADGEVVDGELEVGDAAAVGGDVAEVAAWTGLVVGPPWT
jgi:hypothetical protein